MESRKESLSALKICRFCLSQDDTLVSLYKRGRTPKNAITLPLKILSCVSIEVYPSDKMPSYICGRCKFFMDLSYEFKRICRQADENILQYVQTGTSLECVSWPSGLNKIYREYNGIKPSKEVSVVKTVMEGGATVQVTTQELSESDAEDEENVYNIKIGDGSDEGSKNTCIKVITSSDKEDTPKAKPKRTPKAINNMERVVVKSQSGVDEECWPCTECDCTYPLQQLLELHKLRKHKEKLEECDQCGIKFINKHDMNVHQLGHSNDLMFQCTACGKKFKRHILLKRHEKLMHSELPQHRCPHCPASFLSLDDLAAHRRKHIRIQKRIYECVICEKKFPGRASLQRHKELVHDLKPAYCCDYCPMRFTSIPKLARHVRSHAAGRAYPCKYCPKTFIKSHHYTRHLRMKHRETVRNRRGPFGELEQFRCDQCEDSFNTQDELIYHSAIHATQNLICPLCQEKFDDVEAVTMHIKSHAHGSEFMCDYCELIFTTKEKLDTHMTIAHDEEVRNEEVGQDDSSMEMEAEDDDDDNVINVKEENGQMIVEIKKADDFLLSNYQEEFDDKMESTMSEDSEVETTYTELSTVDPMAMISKESKVQEEKPVSKAASEPAVITRTGDKTDRTASILRKVEEMKRKVVQQNPPEPVSEKKEKTSNKIESTNSAGSNDKSLRLLEKELQELKRTNSRPETVKVVTAKSIDTIRNRRPQIHTSTPKIRNVDEKKSQQMIKIASTEKKIPERRLITKENKEPKEIKENKNNNSKDDKDKEVKEKVTVVKNGTPVEEGVRRSTRPSKIKDYAKMIRESSQASDCSDDDSDEMDDDDEEFKEVERVSESRSKIRRSSAKQNPVPKPSPGSGTPAAPAAAVSSPAAPATPAAPAGAAPAPRKRGRPRKFPPTVPNKIKKDDTEEKGESKQEDAEEENMNKNKETPTPTPEKVNEIKKNTPERPVEVKASSNILVSPTGQTLKKVPVKSLPPGVKPLPLPVNARLGSAEVCEMQIGKKVVKVQKIVMTKAEVEEMAKKGLVEMKDGTMVLKQGIKIPQQDSSALKSTLVEGEPSKESPSKKDKATPTRCDFGDEAL